MRNNLFKRTYEFSCLCLIRGSLTSLLFLRRAHQVCSCVLDCGQQFVGKTSFKLQLNLCKTATLKRPQNCFFMTNYRLLQVKRIAECSKERILQYFRPSLSYHLSLRSLFCLLLSGRFTQVLLYCILL